MNVFVVFGLLFLVIGIIILVVWMQDHLNNPYSYSANDGLFMLAGAFVKISAVLIIAWLFMRATGFKLGYLLPIFATIGGIYYGYLADTSSSQAEYGDLISKKYIFLVAGFITFTIIAVAATS